MTPFNRRCSTPGIRALALLALLLFPLSSGAGAQDGGEGTAGRQAEALPQGRRGAGRGGLLMRLNLTPEQLVRMREISRQNMPELRALARRLNAARRALDEAIYADDADESVIEERAREVASAQAALVRLRARTELQVRRVLTPEQLGQFRELRRQAGLRRLLERGRGRGPNARRTERDPPGARDGRPADTQAPADLDSRPPRPRPERRRGADPRRP